MEKGTRAFVAFVQSYMKHECSLIFRLKGIATALILALAAVASVSVLFFHY